MKQFQSSIVFSATFLLSLSLFANDNKVIYGVDNRLDVYQTKNPLYLELAKSTAAMITSSNIKTLGNQSYISGETLKERHGVCSSALFADQVTSARCSGFLVAPDLLVTAGHCMKTQDDCSDNLWVFDFKMTGPNTAPKNVSSDQVYRCTEIIDQVYTKQNDYALIRLDRRVSDRKPLQVRTQGKISNNVDLLMIGHPSGLPTKIADGANLRENGNPYFFVSNTDSFGGNSGSAIFDAETGLVEGILVRGEDDYEQQSSGCSLPKVCSKYDCRGEDITRITNIEILSKIDVPSVPENISFNNVKATSANFSWSSSDSLAYEYRLSIDPAPFANPDCSKLEHSSLKGTYSVSDLKPSTAYVVTICAVNAVGYFSKPIQKSFSTRAFLPIPQTPTQLTALNVKASSAELKWNSSDSLTQSFVFDFVKKEYAQNITCDSLSLKADASTKSYLLNNFRSDSEYTFIICAQNEDGLFSAPSQIEFKTLSIPSPKDLTVENLSADQATLRWNGESTRYSLVIKKNEDYLDCEDGIYTTSPTYKVQELEPFTKYFVRVCGFESSIRDVSKESATLAFTTQAPLVNVEQTLIRQIRKRHILKIHALNFINPLRVHLNYCLVKKNGKEKSCQAQTATIAAGATEVLLEDLRSKSNYSLTMSFPDYPALPPSKYTLKTP